MSLPFRSLVVTSALLGALSATEVCAQDFSGSDGDEARVVFSYTFPPRIESYNLGSQQWETPRTVSAPPRAVAVDGTRAFVGTAERVLIIDLQTGAETAGPAVPNLLTLDVIGERLFVSAGRDLRVYDKNSLQLLATGNAWYSKFSNIATTPAMDRFAYATSDVSPSDVAWLRFDPATNAFGTSLETPYHGAYPMGGKSWFSTDGQRMLNQGGVLYRSSDLVYVGSVGEPVDQAFAHGDGFIARTGATIRLLNANGLPIGQYALPGPARHLHRHSGGLVGFVADSGTLVAHHRPFSELQAAPRATPAATLGTIDMIVPAAGSRFLLIDRARQTVHVYDRRRRKVVDMFGLSRPPVQAHVRQSDDRLFVGYAGGLIHSVQLLPRAPEIPFTATAYTPGSIVATDQMLFTCDTSGAWAAHWVFDNAGNRINWLEWNHCNGEFEWHAPTRRLYQFTAHSPLDLEWERFDLSGQLVDSRESPLHGGINGSSLLRVNPSGSLAFTGAGQVFDAVSLDLVGTIPFSPVDIAWGNSAMWVANADRVHKLSPAYVSSLSLPLNGIARRLFSDGRTLTAISVSTLITSLYRVHAITDASASGLDIELGADPVVSPSAPILEVTIANLATSGQSIPALGVTLPAGASVLSWTCAAFDGAQCAAAAGNGTPTPGPISAQGYVRFRLTLNVAGLALPMSGQVAVTMPDDGNPDNNVAQFQIADLSVFADGFE